MKLFFVFLSLAIVCVNAAPKGSPSQEGDSKQTEKDTLKLPIRKTKTSSLRLSLDTSRPSSRPSSKPSSRPSSSQQDTKSDDYHPMFAEFFNSIELFREPSDEKFYDPSEAALLSPISPSEPTFAPITPISDKLPPTTPSSSPLIERSEPVGKNKKKKLDGKLHHPADAEAKNKSKK